MHQTVIIPSENQSYLNNSKAEVAFIEHNDFVLIRSIIKHMPIWQTI